MKKKGTANIQRGQAITFRLPSDTPDHLLRQLQNLKETERRNFSSKMAEFVLEGVNNSLAKERETVTLPLPKKLSKDQRNWLKHSHSEALLGTIVYHLLNDPIRATSILASLNSNALDIDDALYLQEDVQNNLEDLFTRNTGRNVVNELEEPEEVPHPIDEEMDDLMDFDWEKAKQEHASAIETDEKSNETEDVEDLLGGFLANMNK